MHNYRQFRITFSYLELPSDPVVTAQGHQVRVWMWMMVVVVMVEQSAHLALQIGS
jgi:hypothetical protein